MKNILRQVYRKLSRHQDILTLNDPFLGWLRSANAGFLNEGNIYSFDCAIRHLRSNSPVVEIGAFCGLSTNVISYLLRKHSKQNQLFVSDPWLFENGYIDGGFIPGTKILFNNYRKHVISSFMANTSFFSDMLPHPIESTSDTFFEKWAARASVLDIFNRQVILGGPISFAYIDGNHTYEYAKRDFHNVDAYLEAGGFILLDDSFDGSPFECAQLARDVLDFPSYKLVHKNPNFLFQKMY
jgi:hypothetical protein